MKDVDFDISNKEPCEMCIFGMLLAVADAYVLDALISHVGDLCVSILLPLLLS